MGESMGPRIAVIAHKGGAGKTTVTANLGAALAGLGRRVLLVDCDPQGALAAMFAASATPPTLHTVLTEGIPAADAIRPTSIEGLDLLPADLDLAAAEIELPGREGWQTALREALVRVDSYGVTLLDTPPGLGVLPYLALLASTAAIVVAPPEFLAYRALSQVLATIKRAEGIAPDLRVLGILPTLVGGRTRHEHDVLEVLRSDHGAHLLPEVPRRVVYQDAALAGQPVTLFAPRSEAAVRFIELAEEVLRRAEATHPARPR
jgi:chromosome partitioning protein